MFVTDYLGKFEGQRSEDRRQEIEYRSPSYELAVLYKEQGSYDDAELLLIQALEGRRLKLGDEHPHTLES